MQLYLNLSGKSGVYAYEIGHDFIQVKFLKTPKIYSYSYRIAGSVHVEQMKILAKQGRGLNTYINKYVYDLYDK